MRRSTSVLIISVLVSFNLNALSINPPSELTDSILNECCQVKIIPLVKLKQKISHSKRARSIKRRSHQLGDNLKQFFQKRRKNRQYRHYAHMTRGRKVNHNASKKMLKKSMAKE